MNIAKKILGNIAKKSVQQPVMSVTPQMTAVQNAARDAFSKNIAELKKFSQTELPQTVANQKTAFEGLEQLAKNVKSML